MGLLAGPDSRDSGAGLSGAAVVDQMARLLLNLPSAPCAGHGGTKVAARLLDKDSRTVTDSSDNDAAPRFHTTAADAPLAELMLADHGGFGDHMVLEQGVADDAGWRGDCADRAVGPCGKSTFLVDSEPDASAGARRGDGGEVRLDGVDIGGARQRLTEARRQIGMVFQKPNPFPTMSIYDNVVAGLKLTGVKAQPVGADAPGARALDQGGAVAEVFDPLRQPASGGLSGGQQQRLHCPLVAGDPGRGCC